MHVRSGSPLNPTSWPALIVLPDPEVGASQQVTVERGVAIGMIDHHVVRAGAVVDTVDLDYRPVANGHHSCATPGAQIHTEVQALARPVKTDAFTIGEDRVAIGLTQHPGVRAGSALEGQAKWPRRILADRTPVRFIFRLRGLDHRQPGRGSPGQSEARSRRMPEPARPSRSGRTRARSVARSAYAAVEDNPHGVYRPLPSEVRVGGSRRVRIRESTSGA